MNRFQYRDEVDRANTVYGSADFLRRLGLLDIQGGDEAMCAAAFLHEVGIPERQWGQDHQDVRLAE